MKVHRLHSIAIAAAAVVSTLVAACGPPTAETMANPAAPPVGVALSCQTDAVIARTQARLRVKPDDWKSVDQLAAAYLQKVREVGDLSYYGKAEALLGEALAHDPADPEATASMGLLALARHQFTAGLAWGARARALDPAASRPLGIIGDAEIELGRYPDAVKSLQQMIDLRPDLSSYARVSYLRELYGDVEGAIAAMQQAIEAGGPVPENSAYTRVLLANIYFNGGRLAEAETQAERALIDDPKYPYALATLAKIDAAPGRDAHAIARYQQAGYRYPPPGFVIGLGEGHAVSRDAAKAGETYDPAACQPPLYQAN